MDRLTSCPSARLGGTGVRGDARRGIAVGGPRSVLRSAPAATPGDARRGISGVALCRGSCANVDPGPARLSPRAMPAGASAGSRGSWVVRECGSRAGANVPTVPAGASAGGVRSGWCEVNGASRPVVRLRRRRTELVELVEVEDGDDRRQLVEAKARSLTVLEAADRRLVDVGQPLEVALAQALTESGEHRL